MNRIVQSVIAALGGVVGVVVGAEPMLGFLMSLPDGAAQAITFGGSALGILCWVVLVPSALGGASSALIVAGIESAFGRRKG